MRTNHVHLVVEAEVRPERVMNDLKSYASRSLNQKGTDEPARKRWPRHGSTRWLWKPEHISLPFATLSMSKANRWLFPRLSKPEADRSLRSRLRKAPGMFTFMSRTRPNRVRDMKVAIRLLSCWIPITERI
ncbi:MAG TPA: hypothetical protein VH640_21760 [Bryobacteraceae bacterium]